MNEFHVDSIPSVSSPSYSLYNILNEKSIPSLKKSVNHSSYSLIGKVLIQDLPNIHVLYDEDISQMMKKSFHMQMYCKYMASPEGHQHHDAGSYKPNALAFQQYFWILFDILDSPHIRFLPARLNKLNNAIPCEKINLHFSWTFAHSHNDILEMAFWPDFWKYNRTVFIL